MYQVKYEGDVPVALLEFGTLLDGFVAVEGAELERCKEIMGYAEPEAPPSPEERVAELEAAFDALTEGLLNDKT
jgi:hypothetical protein